MSDETGHADCGDTATDMEVICANCGQRYGAHFLRNCPAKDGSKTDGIFIPAPSLPPAPLEKEIRAECQAIADFLVAKNRAYGNSASEPCRIFAKRVDPLAQIDCRIDDKLNRLMKGTEYPGDDSVLDLAGYLILRMIVAEKQRKDAE